MPLIGRVSTIPFLSTFRNLSGDALTIAGVPIKMSETPGSVRTRAPMLGEHTRDVLVSLGYAAWGQGQLESELAENSWLTVGADPRIIFETPLEQRYDQALALLGLQPWMLSPGAGHA